jgi:hypothetical protein
MKFESWALRACLVLVGTWGCGGSPSPTAPSAAVSRANPNGFIYAQAADGFWGFRVEATGVLAPVANQALSASVPSFSRDGKKAAFWDGRVLSVRAVETDGSFSPVIAQIGLSDLLRNAPGNRGYRAVWNLSGTTIVLIGGSALQTTTSPFFPTEIVAVSHASERLNVLLGGVATAGRSPSLPLFASDDTFVIKHYGSSPSLDAQLVTYSMSSGILHEVQTVRIGNLTDHSTLEAFITPDERFIVTGDIAYSRSPSELKFVGRSVNPLVSGADPMFDTLQLHDRHFLVTTYRPRFDDLAFSTFSVLDDGRLPAITPLVIGAFAEYPLVAARKGEVVVVHDPDRQRIRAIPVDSVGRLGAFQATTMSVPSSFTVATDATGAFLYLFSETGSTAGSIDTSGRIVPFEPFAAGSTFRYTARTPVVAKP